MNVSEPYKKRGDIMRPVIDPEGCVGWVSQQEYNETKWKWLDPFWKDIIKLLGKI